MKIKILTLLILFAFNVCFGASNINEQLSEIENSIWGFTYEKDNQTKRLNRIEANVFGQQTQNQTVEERVKKISTALGIETEEEKVRFAKQEYIKEEADVNYPQIDRIEYQMFQETYQKENIYKRLERLEKKIFGSTQEGTLASRTDKLNAYIQQDEISQSPNYYTKKPYTTTADVENYMNSQSRYDSDLHIQLAGLETALFNKTYSQDPVGLRFNRLERKIFQRDFSSDDEQSRITRLQAAMNAQQTAKLYEANKIQKYASTGIQLGSIILMILALIL